MAICFCRLFSILIIFLITHVLLGRSVNVFILSKYYDNKPFVVVFCLPLSENNLRLSRG